MRLFQGVFTAAVVGLLSCAWGKPSAEPVPLFQSGGVGARSSELQINPVAVDSLRSGAGSLALGAVPLITGAAADFVLTPMPVFASDATIEIISDDGTTSSAAIPDIDTWYGQDPNDPLRVMFLSADAAGKVRIMITGDENTSVTAISPIVSGGGDTYQIEATNVPAENFCSTDGTMDESETVSGQTSVSGSANSNVLYEIEMMLDVGHNLYNKLGGDETRVLDYVTDLFGAVSSIYQRDLKARFTLTHVAIWSGADPFSRWPSALEASADTQLGNYGNYIVQYRTMVHRDLSHFIDYNPGLGGVAYLNVLDAYNRPIRYGISNVYGEEGPSDIGTYFWDTTVVAHEIGHNVGSHHTHCYSPPIDCCYFDPNDTRNACGMCTIAKPTVGTIMSYCHLNSTISMVFHPRCIELMRIKIENSLLLTPFDDQPNIDVRGVDGLLAPSDSIAGAATTLKAPAEGGAPIVQTFTIKNTGSQNLNLTGNPAVAVSGSNFITVASPPSASVIEPGQSTTFDLEFDPQSSVDQFAQVKILSNDPDTPNYDIAVMGRLVRPSAPNVTTFNGAVPIVELGDAWTVITLRVEDVPGLISDVDVKFNGADCSNPEQTGLQHPWVGDLEILAYSPSGTSVTLMKRPGTTTDTLAGSGGAHFCNTLLDDDPAMPLIQEITTDGAPYTGTYQPAEAFAKLNGEEANGDWRFYFYDWARPDIGYVRSFSLIIRGEIGGGSATDARDWNLYD